MRASSYPVSVRWMHWVTVLLVLGGVTMVLLREELEGKPLKRLLMTCHQTAGLLVLLLVLVRLWTVMKHCHQLPVHPLPLLLRLAAKATHVVLYLALLAVPLIGWVYVSAKGHPPALFGVLPMPALVAEDMDLADTLSDWHVWLGYAFLSVIAAHVVAALWHHLVKKDGVLTSMWSR